MVVVIRSVLSAIAAPCTAALQNAQTLRVSGVKFNDYFPENARMEGNYDRFPGPDRNKGLPSG
jgi:hypothetical protein